jgi:hypothetical protein
VNLLDRIVFRLLTIRAPRPFVSFSEMDLTSSEPDGNMDESAKRDTEGD